MDNREYRRFYRALFGEVSSTDTMFSNLGKAIAAFERTVMPTASRFDEYVAAVVAEDVQRQRALFSKNRFGFVLILRHPVSARRQRNHSYGQRGGI